MNSLERGFPVEEFRGRTQRAQDLMRQHGLSALLLTTEPEVRYFTGFLTRFWESPTRPWFTLVPVNGSPIAVIPAIGGHLMAQTWVRDIRTWNAPDYSDDGVGLLSETIREVVPDGGKIGLADQIESHLRMPLASLQRLRNSIGRRELVGDCTVTRTLRLTKSNAEIAKIATAIAIADRAFARLGEFVEPGVPLSTVFRQFQSVCLQEGADWIPYLAGAAEPGGYRDVISPASDRPLAKGDLLMLDTGVVWDGYFCDFDRNFSIGAPSQALVDAHARLIEATQAAFLLAKPGKAMSDLYHAMNAVLDLPAGSGRLGHGLGMQLTEWPSILPEDDTEILPGMVLTLEPVVELPDGKIMVHEENVVIRGDGPQFLTVPSAPSIVRLC